MEANNQLEAIFFWKDGKVPNKMKNTCILSKEKWMEKKGNQFFGASACYYRRKDRFGWVNKYFQKYIDCLYKRVQIFFRKKKNVNKKVVYIKVSWDAYVARDKSVPQVTFNIFIYIFIARCLFDLCCYD